MSLPLVGEVALGPSAVLPLPCNDDTPCKCQPQGLNVVYGEKTSVPRTEPVVPARGPSLGWAIALALCPALPCRACPVALWPCPAPVALPCPALPCGAMPCPVGAALPCPAPMPCPVLPCPVVAGRPGTPPHLWHLCNTHGMGPRPLHSHHQQLQISP